MWVQGSRDSGGGGQETGVLVCTPFKLVVLYVLSSWWFFTPQHLIAYTPVLTTLLPVFERLRWCLVTSRTEALS